MLDHLRSIPGIHQLSSVTAFDRYPALFTTLARHKTPGRILSFGCSTGEECATVRKYWPSANIVGVDVNKQSLDTARHRHPVAQYHHVTELPTLGTFDLVLALSVLCRHHDTKNEEDISVIYPFRLFEDAVAQIVAASSAAAVIVIVNANYRFEDTRYAKGFRPLLIDDFQDEVFHARVRRFSRDGIVLPDQQATAVFARNMVRSATSATHRWTNAFNRAR